jgi:hypothetical protein
MSERVLENPRQDQSGRSERAGASVFLIVERRAGRKPVDSSDASIGRAAVRGAIVGFFFVVVLVGTILFVAAGVSVGVALAVGAYVGLWGGPGWGGMVAAQARADRLDEDERCAARSQGERPALHVHVGGA